MGTYDIRNLPPILLQKESKKKALRMAVNSQHFQTLARRLAAYNPALPARWCGLPARY